MSSPAEQQSERISLGLIEYLSRHTLDEDYARLARRTAGEAGARRPGTGRSATAAALATLALFGLLVYTAASQTTRNAVSENGEREQLVKQTEARRDAVDAKHREVRRLQDSNAKLNEDLLTGTRSGMQVSAGLTRLAMLTGAAAVTGPGVRVVVDDAPNASHDRERVLDSDLQKLINGLWESGAEAISVNGQRITNLTPIREAGRAITVNFRSLKAPYTVLAIGDSETMPSRFAESSSGATWFDLQSQVGLRFAMTPDRRMTIPAAPEEMTLRYAERAKGGRP